MKPFEEARLQLLTELVDDERLFAEGRVDEIEPRIGPSGSTYDYILVTDRRLLIGKNALGADRSRDFEIPLAAVGSYAA